MTEAEKGSAKLCEQNVQVEAEKELISLENVLLKDQQSKWSHLQINKN